MCRCRRLAAIILSLALVASFFVLNTSAAETGSFLQARVAYSTDNGETWSTNNWVPVNDFSWCAANGITASKLWRIDKFRILPSYSKNVDYWISFSVGLIHNTTSTQLNGYFRPATNSTHSYTLSNSNIKSVIVWSSLSGQYNYTNAVEPISDAYNQHTRNCQNYIIKFRGNFDSPGSNQMTEIVLDDVLLFSTDTSNTNNCTPFFFNCSVLQTYAYILNSQFDLINTNVSTISQNLVTANTKFDSMITQLGLIRQDTHAAAIAQEATYGLFSPLFDSDYSWNEVSYDPETEELSTEEKSGSWWDAIVGLFKSINSDAESQAAMQEKANSAGAGDALNDAYDSAGSGSFGALSDFSGISEAASWNGNNFSTQTQNGFLSWFSQACANDIDSTTRTRNEEQDIIDLYSDHIAEIQEILGGDNK